MELEYFYLYDDCKHLPYDGSPLELVKPKISSSGQRAEKYVRVYGDDVDLWMLVSEPVDFGLKYGAVFNDHWELALLSENPYFVMHSINYFHQPASRYEMYDELKNHPILLSMDVMHMYSYASFELYARNFPNKFKILALLYGTEDPRIMAENKIVYFKNSWYLNATREDFNDVTSILPRLKREPL